MLRCHHVASGNGKTRRMGNPPPLKKSSHAFMHAVLLGLVPMSFTSLSTSWFFRPPSVPFPPVSYNTPQFLAGRRYASGFARCSGNSIPLASTESTQKLHTKSREEAFFTGAPLFFLRGWRSSTPQQTSRAHTNPRLFTHAGNLGGPEKETKGETRL